MLQTVSSQANQKVIHCCCYHVLEMKHDKFVGYCKTGTINRRLCVLAFYSLKSYFYELKLLQPVSFSTRGSRRDGDLASLLLKFIHLLLKKRYYHSKGKTSLL